jgi:hypothetical protein
MEPVMAVFLFISIFVFVALFYGPWQALCIDWARQKMFEARDRVFDAAAGGLISFDSAEYRTIRTSIERMIQFCHEISWPRFFLYWLVLSHSHEDRIGKAIKGIPNAKGREIASQAIVAVARSTLLCFAGRSIILGPLFLLARCMHYVNEGVPMMVYNAAERDAEGVDRYVGRRAGKVAA